MELISSAHKNEFDSQPEIIVKAPCHIHLIGEHSWFFKDKTLSLAVNLPIYLAISKRLDSSLRCYFHQIKERKRANLSSLKYRKEDRWANAIKSVVFSFLQKGFDIPGLNISIYSDIPPSLGFGVTSAIRVSTAYALKTLLNLTCKDEQLIENISFGYQSFTGKESLIADIYSIMYSKENTCLLSNYADKSYQHIPFNTNGKSIILTDAQVPRILVWEETSIHTKENISLLTSLKTSKNNDIVYEDSSSEISDVLSDISEDNRKKLISIIKEYQCVNEAVDALNKNSFSVFARAVNHSHEIMRDMYNISCPEIDWLVKRVQEFDSQTMKSNTTACSRITGKGFGRCTYTIINENDEESYYQKLQEYERIFGFHASYYKVKPASGIIII